MLRKIWIAAALTCACVALTPDTAEAGRRRSRKNCCPQTCCNTCNTCNTGGYATSGCSSCGGCGGAMVGAPMGTMTAPPPVATK